MFEAHINRECANCGYCHALTTDAQLADAQQDHTLSAGIKEPL